MRNGRFHTPKCREQASKRGGVLYIHYPKMPRSSSKVPKQNKNIFLERIDGTRGPRRGEWVTAGCWPALGP
jgi:hypothetical protein